MGGGDGDLLKAPGGPVFSLSSRANWPLVALGLSRLGTVPRHAQLKRSYCQHQFLVSNLDFPYTLWLLPDV